MCPVTQRLGIQNTTTAPVTLGILEKAIAKMENQNPCVSMWETGVFEPGLFREKNVLDEIIVKTEKQTEIECMWETGLFEPGLFREKNVLDKILKKLEKI